MNKTQLRKMIDTLHEMPVMSALPAYAQLEKMTQRLDTQEFRIVVIGEFSSGKSTFINALIHEDLLGHSKEETTATITRLIQTPPGSKMYRRCQIIFANGKKLILNDFSALKDYTTTHSKCADVVSEIEEVRLYVPIEEISSSLMLVDTPGMNGVADGHREKTIQEVQRAHACIYMLQLRGINDADIQFLRVLTQYQSQFLFVQNFIDDLKESDGETPKQKLDQLRQTLKERVFYDQPQVEFRICGISALWALAHFDSSIERLYENDSTPLSQTERKALLKKSGLPTFYEALQKLFPPQKLKVLQCRSTETALLHWLVDAHDLLTLRAQRNVKDREFQSQNDRQQHLIEILTRVRGNAQRNVEKITNYITAQQAEIRRRLEKEIHEKCTAIGDDFKESIGKCRSLEELEECWDAKRINGWLADRVFRFGQELRADDTEAMIYLSNHIIARIEEYCGMGCDDLHLEIKEGALLAGDAAHPRVDTGGDHDKLRRMRAQMKQVEAEREQVTKKLETALSEQEQAKKEQELYQQQLSKQAQFYRQEISQKGARPAKKEIPYTAEREVYRGGMGFLDKLLGPKIEKHTEYRYDDSAGRNWDFEIQKLNQKFEHDKKSKERLKDAATKRLQQAVLDYEEHRGEPVHLQKKIDGLKKEIQSQEEYLRVVEENAKSEYLALRKKQICIVVFECLLGEGDSVLQQARENLSQSLERDCASMTAQAASYLQEATARKIQQLEEAISGGEIDLCAKFPDYAQELQLIEQDLELLKGELEI